MAEVDVCEVPALLGIPAGEEPVELLRVPELVGECLPKHYGLRCIALDGEPRGSGRLRAASDRLSCSGRARLRPVDAGTALDLRVDRRLAALDDPALAVDLQ